MYHLSVLAQSCHEESHVAQSKCCTHIYNILKDKEGKKLELAIDNVVKSGAIAKIIQFLHFKFNNHPLQFKTTSILSSIFTNTTKYTEMIVKCGIIPYLLQLLVSCNLEIANELSCL